MRIALTASLVAPILEAEANGPHSVIVDLARGLQTRGHDVTVYAASGSAIPGVALVEIPVAALAARAAVRADGQVNADARAALGRGFEQMFTELRASDAEVISQHAFDAPAFDLARDLPIVHTLHLPPVDADVVRAARASSGSLVTVSDAPARAWHAAGVRDVTVIRNGVPDAPPEREGTPGEPFALVAGRVSPEKGTHVAIRAARRAGVPVRVVGDIYDRDYYEHEVAPLLEPGYEIRPLPRQELMALMQHAAVTLMPVSWDEAFGLVAAEAQMCGCPVVGYRRGALPEVVLDGLSGFLVTPDDEAALVNAIGPGLALDRGSIAARAQASFGLGQMIDRYEALLTTVAQRATA